MALRSILADQTGLLSGVDDTAKVEQLLKLASTGASDTASEAKVPLAELIEQVQVTETGLRVTVKLGSICKC
jgi:hypothetical protein